MEEEEGNQGRRAVVQWKEGHRGWGIEEEGRGRVGGLLAVIFGWWRGGLWKISSKNGGALLGGGGVQARARVGGRARGGRKGVAVVGVGGGGVVTAVGGGGLIGGAGGGGLVGGAGGWGRAVVITGHAGQG